MGMVHCFRSESGELICIPVYVLVRKLLPDWWWKAAPTDPSPWKWVEHPRISPELTKDLATIALINELAGTLKRGRDKAIKAAAEAALRDVQLPPGVTVSLNPQPIPPGKRKAAATRTK